MEFRSSPRKSFILVVFLAVFLPFFGTGCRKSVPEKIQNLLNDQSCTFLKIGLVSYPRELNPILSLDESARFLCNMLHRSPLKRNSDGTFTPDLWSEWSSSKDAQGNLVVHGTWRDQIKWHDGTPFSPKDFLFTVEAMKNPENQSPFSRLAEKISSIESTDSDRGCNITFKGNSVQFLDLLAVGVIPSHVLSKQKLQDATISLSPDLEFSSFGVASGQMRYSDAPIGLGPYKMVGGGGKSYLIFESWPPAPGSLSTDVSTASAIAPRNVLIRFYYRPEELLDDLRNGKIEWAHIPSEFSTKFEEMKVAGCQFVRFANPSYLMLGFNCSHPALSHREIRKALNLAINRQKLKETIPYDGRLLDGPPMFSGLATGSVPAPVSPEMVSGLLDSSGCKDVNGDGWREYDQKPFSLDILVNQDNLLRKLIAEEMARDFQKFGIKATVTILPWAEIINDRLARGNFSAFLLGFQAPLNGNWLNLWHSTEAKPEASSTFSLGESCNFTGFSSKELDEALEALDALPAPGDPLPLRQKVLSILQEEIPGCFLFSQLDMAIVSDRLTGYSKVGEIWEQNIETWKKQEYSKPAK